MNSRAHRAAAEKANEQHYEVPPEFFAQGSDRTASNSCCHWGRGRRPRRRRGAHARYHCERRHRRRPNDLELGCGGASLTVAHGANVSARHHPRVSNSRPQRAFILRKPRAAVLPNVDVAHLRHEPVRSPRSASIGGLSVELFEHMRKPAPVVRADFGLAGAGGGSSCTSSCTARCPMLFEDRGESDWMSRHFLLRRHDAERRLPLMFRRHLRLERQWSWSGTHYQKTANAWLANHRCAARRGLPISEALGASRLQFGCKRGACSHGLRGALGFIARDAKWVVSHLPVVATAGAGLKPPPCSHLWEFLGAYQCRGSAVFLGRECGSRHCPTGGRAVGSASACRVAPALRPASARSGN
jgi:cyclopropane fatty-acyl-phospholipid synthase-like methyltransferase